MIKRRPALGALSQETPLDKGFFQAYALPESRGPTSVRSVRFFRASPANAAFMTDAFPTWHPFQGAVAAIWFLANLQIILHICFILRMG